MATESIRVSGLIPATPKRVYEAWLDSREHSRFTGGKATVEPGIGGSFTAWGGYIQGKNLELEAGKRILQSWRSTDFPEDAEDSRLEVILEPRGASETEISFLHSGIPEGQGHKYEGGWVENYLTPMRRYFATHAESPAVTAAAAAAAKAKAAVPAAKPKAKTPPPVAARSARAKKKVAAKKPAPKKAAAAGGKRVAQRKGKARPAAKASVKKTASKKAKAKQVKKRPAKKSKSR